MKNEQASEREAGEFRERKREEFRLFVWRLLNQSALV